MKKLTAILLILFSFSAQAQWILDFDTHATNDFTYGYLIDTSNPGNLWQVGRPQKAVFDAAYTQPNAILTDTLNTYPAHDTCSFTLYHARDFLLGVLVMRLQFYYKLDVAAQASGKLEMSGDRGVHWIDMLTEDSVYHIQWISPKPRLDTSVHTWTYVDIRMKDWILSRYPPNDTFPSNFTADSILFRFTFRSGSVVAPHDGWMIDNIAVVDSGMGDHVPELRNDDLINVFPNPSGGTFSIVSSAPVNDYVIEVCSITGTRVFRQQGSGPKCDIVSSLPPGPYILRYSNHEKYAMKQILITH